MKRTVTPRTGGKPQPTSKLLQSPSAHTSSSAAALESVDAQAKHELLISTLLGPATGVGHNKLVAKRLMSQFQQMLLGQADPETTLLMLTELRPGSILECMLLTQMIGTHEAALGFLKTSTADDLGQFRDQNVSRSTRLMRLFMEQLEQLQRMRGTTRQQRVTVEHVHVNAGGQAIVGVVGSPEGGIKNNANG